MNTSSNAMSTRLNLRAESLHAIVSSKWEEKAAVFFGGVFKHVHLAIESAEDSVFWTIHFHCERPDQTQWTFSPTIWRGSSDEIDDYLKSCQNVLLRDIANAG